MKKQEQPPRDEPSLDAEYDRAQREAEDRGQEPEEARREAARTVHEQRHRQRSPKKDEPA